MSKLGFYIEKARRMPAYASLVFNKHYGDWLIDHKKFTKVSYSPADMFFLQVKDGEFRRPDMIVRHLFIDNYYGKNDFGFDLYRKLQDTRVKKGYAEEAVKKFCALIESYEKNGYDTSSYILADKELKLRDGSHRMAMATYLNLPEITVAVFNATTALVLDYKWLLDHGFSKEEVDILRTKAEALQKELNTPLECVVSDDVENISELLAQHGTVTETKAAELCEEQLAELKKLYPSKEVKPQCTVVKLQLKQPQYMPLKFAQQPVFVQTARATADLGPLGNKLCMPQNFRDNAKTAQILK